MLLGLAALPWLATASLAQASTPIYGITIDRVPSRPQAVLGALAALPRRPTTRVYFDVHEPASYYSPFVAQLHGVSAVMGELLDSSDERAITVAAFQERVRSYLTTLAGEVDIWEVGNEVNGNWTGPYETVSAKLTEAYEEVSAAGGRTALTLYANQFGPEHCGDGEAEPTPVQFSERYVPADVAAGLDYVFLSYYPSECGGRMPSSLEVALAMEALHTLYPHALLGFGEIGLPHAASRHTLAEAEAIMSWAYSLHPSGVGGQYFVGGYFWWYGDEDVLKPRARLAKAFNAALEDESAAIGG